MPFGIRTDGETFFAVSSANSSTGGGLIRTSLVTSNYVAPKEGKAQLMANDERKAHLDKMLAHTAERVRNFQGVLEYAAKSAPDAVVFDRLAEACGDVAGSVTILAGRAGDYAAELLDGEE